MLSGHKFGGCIDCDFDDVTAEEVRQYILNNPEQFPHITALEANVSWLHFDVRVKPWSGIKLINP
jgi:hypothetical protein